MSMDDTFLRCHGNHCPLKEGCTRHTEPPPPITTRPWYAGWWRTRLLEEPINRCFMPNGRSCDTQLDLFEPA